jgi:hypothetical protein
MLQPPVWIEKVKTFLGQQTYNSNTSDKRQVYGVTITFWVFQRGWQRPVANHAQTTTYFHNMEQVDFR